MIPISGVARGVQHKNSEIDGATIAPSNTAVHVVLVRSAGGNGEHISLRVSAKRRTDFGLMNCGLVLLWGGVEPGSSVNKTDDLPTMS